MTQVYRFMEGDWGILESTVIWFKDPHSMGWISEYKVSKLVKRNRLTRKDARYVVRHGLSKFPIQVGKKHYADVQQTLDADGKPYYFANGIFFVPDEETQTYIKMMYS